MSGKMAQMPGTSQSDYYSIDPSGHTQATANNLYGQPAQDIMRRGNEASMAWALPSTDPNSFMAKYLSDFGQLQGAVTDATSPLSKQLESQLMRNINLGNTQIGNQFAGMGGLRSSGMADVAGRMAGQEAGNASTALAQQQLGLLQPLANQQMLGRQYALSEQMKQPMDLMGMQAQFGAPAYGAPQYYQKPGAMDWMSATGDLLSGIGSIVPF